MESLELSTNMKKILLIILIGTSTLIQGQSNAIIILQNINLPKDTVVNKGIISALNGFLNLKEKANNENIFILNEDLLETSILLDEMKGIEKSDKFKDDNFYKGYLTNLVQLDKSNYLIQLSYIGINENTPILVASFEVLCKQKENQFYISSPLKKNTS